MPRRNARAQHESFNANVILGEDYKFTLDPEEAAARRKRRQERAEAAQKRLVESTKSTWTRCVVPDCTFQVPRQLRNGIEFPVCTLHAVAVWVDIETRADDPTIQEATAALRARRKVIRAEWEAEEARIEEDYRKRFAAGMVNGHIYFIRANGLVKVGWSSDVESRLRAYGPNIEILCLYPATRQDETTLHRQLKPSRAKGREWYADDPIIQAFVAEALEKYGPPWVKVVWSGPNEIVAAKRTRRR
jgi:hypothetical protein